MPVQPPRYRLASVGALPRARVAEHFEAELRQSDDRQANTWHLRDGSVLVLRPSAVPDQVYVELHCQFQVSGGSVTYGLLPRFIALCEQTNGKIRSVRSGSVLPASGGAVTSDVWASRADMVARHIASHPKDLKALERFAAEASKSNLK